MRLSESTRIVANRVQEIVQSVSTSSIVVLGAFFHRVAILCTVHTTNAQPGCNPRLETQAAPLLHTMRKTALGAVLALVSTQAEAGQCGWGCSYDVRTATMCACAQLRADD